MNMAASTLEKDLTKGLGFHLPEKPVLLCLGAHCDDIEIGCGGSLLRLSEQYPDAEIHWVVFTSNAERAEEAKACAAAFTQAFKSVNITVHGHRDGFLPTAWSQVKECFESLKTVAQPDLIFTHYGQDKHQDHRVVSELTWNTFRNHAILEYEIPKWDGDLGQPNVFMPITEETLRKKSALLQKHYNSQGKRSWFTEDLFMALPRLRGMECQSRYAEAFYSRKLVWRT